MTIEVKVPMLPESIADATISTWHKKVGDAVKRGENLVDLETDKVMLEVPAPSDGTLKEILKEEGEVVQANQAIAIVSTGTSAEKSNSSKEDVGLKEKGPKDKETKDKEPHSKPSTENTNSEQSVNKNPESEKQSIGSPSTLGPAARRAALEGNEDDSRQRSQASSSSRAKERPTPQKEQESKPRSPTAEGRIEKRVPMTRIRARIAERLLDVTQNTAMLTTFNEINLQHVINLRSQYKDKFEKLHNVRLGFMSFFIKAAVEALKRSPAVNASIDASDIVYHGYFDIGVAVSTDRGLVVPVIRNADQLGMADIEKQISDYATKARNGKLTLEEMQGGTFSITNGGVFGSLLATPIINAPQSAILGMHKIQDRPVVENGQIVVRPMMYIALSYDHRIIDGKESVTFLVTIKELLEDPARLLLEI